MRNIFALTFTLFFCFSSIWAEDGSALWLRYASGAKAEITSKKQSPTLRIAVSELQNFWQGGIPVTLEVRNNKELRSRLKKQRGLLGAYECHNMSHDIYKRLIALELDREYDNILLYSAIRNEVNTDEYFTYLVNKAKRIYYPRVSGNKMSFYRVRSLDELNCGSFNIKEPDMTKEYTQADGRALMIVPGLAFSDTGYRIGYGKGFYDRYLSSFTKRDTVMAVGVGYDFQLLSGMTFEDEYDVPLDGVITDKREVFIDE